MSQMSFSNNATVTNNGTLTSGQIAICNGTTQIKADANLDDGLSTANTLTYTGTAGISAKQLTSSVTTGTAPLVVASTTQVTNLNASQLIGNTWVIPGTIGSTTPNTGAFTTLAAGSAKFNISASGVPILSDNLTLVGEGFPLVLAKLDQTGVSTANSGTPQNILASTPSAGFYEASVYISQNAGCTTVGSASVTLNINWTDDVHTRNTTAFQGTFTPTTTAGGNVNAFTVMGPIPFFSATASAITTTVTYVACSSGTWTYNLHAEVSKTH